MTENTSITNIEVCLAMLAQHRKVHLLSLCLTLLSAGAIVFSYLYISSTILELIPLILVLAFGAVELTIAIRIGFDQQLLISMNKYRDTDKQMDIDKEFSLLDDILIELELVKTKKPKRLLTDRLLGCIKLIKQQWVLCSLQLIMIVSVPLLA
ncbi:MAG: hypothetical protein GY746_07950 [Gammaproteobacteria bacterium]|nr:hypothetical protein [Gammaproteobacteria bacterium]MCP4089712.1 hypothetical protein [Gammaproteobacteria bacterium]